MSKRAPSEGKSATLCCPACEGVQLAEIYRLPAIPVQSCVLLETKEDALSFPRAPLVLQFCDTCGFMFNSAFDPSLVDYASATEESQHFSGTFNAFARGLVSEIAEQNALSGKLTLEIGCGKGDFLLELVQRTGTRAIGIDPGHLPERMTGYDRDQIDFRREYFDPGRIEVAPDFVVCRHTLEHIKDVARFTREIADLPQPRTGASVFFETPDARRVLADGAFWDIYYEHCSYFSLGSHARLFRRAGFEVTDLRLAYGGQYIVQTARSGGSGPILPSENDLAEMRALAAAFPGLVARTRKRWTDLIATQCSEGRNVSLWGGGSKAVSFLTTNDIQAEIARVVDINPYKQGRFLPGSAHRVSAPSELAADPPDTVIVMNSIYMREIGEHLNTLGLAPKLLAV